MSGCGCVPACVGTCESVSLSGSTSTKCDRDRANNVWVEGEVDEDGNGGVCMLDTLTESNIVYILERDERAREDLKKVTSDARLLALADAVPRLETTEPGDKLQKQLNPTSIPFYSLFRGNPPFAQ